MEEVKERYKVFMELCPSGHLSQPEFSNIYSQFYPTGNVDHFAHYVFDLFDVDGNGTIEFPEFLVVLSVTSSGRLEDKIEWAFRLYDLDKNGSVSKVEMLEIVNAILDMTGSDGKSDRFDPEKQVEKMFQLMDTDGNGELSREEFLQGASQDNSFFAAALF